MGNNLNRPFSFLKARGMIQSSDLVIALSDMLQSIQVITSLEEQIFTWKFEVFLSFDYDFLGFDNYLRLGNYVFNNNSQLKIQQLGCC
uniref:Uncharacterized protein n=1 Tax=Nelumbo nucifera TaxID=4432 RepID=A0A822YZI5_NELNU|nr:TPA_asm: hypothetical protein HUJ06_007276 [Nelumbo nucifera]